MYFLLGQYRLAINNQTEQLTYIVCGGHANHTLWAWSQVHMIRLQPMIMTTPQHYNIQLADSNFASRETDVGGSVIQSQVQVDHWQVADKANCYGCLQLWGFVSRRLLSFHQSDVPCIAVVMNTEHAQ